MSKYELVAFIITMPTLAITIVTIAQLYFKRPSADAKSGLSDATEARLARIEQAVDSIAVEVERISEAQRFSVKLLAEGQRAVGALPATHHAEDRIRG